MFDWNRNFVVSNAISQMLDLIPLIPVEGCDARNYTKFSTTLQLELKSATGTITEAQLAEVSQIMLETYNELNLLNGQSCDPHRRQVLSISGQTEEVEDESQETNRIMFDVSGLCLGCSVTTNMLDSPSSESARDLQGQEVIDVEQGPTCLCPESATVHRSPTIEEFGIKLGANLEATSFVEGIVSIEEKNIVSCGGEAIAFQKIVPIQYDVICELFDDDIPLLVAAYEALYNILAEDYYCDPLHRRITRVTVRSIGDKRVDGSKINMELLVEGTCQGCDPDTVTLFGEMSLTDGRLLQVIERAFDEWPEEKENGPNSRGRSLEVCFCDNELLEGAISEVEFMQVYQAFIQEKLSEFFCIVSTGTCDFGSTFQSIVLVAFDMALLDAVLPDDFLFALETTVLSSLEFLYREDDGGCNQDFREFQVSIGILNVNFNPNDYYSTTSHDDDGFDNVTLSPPSFPTISPSLPSGDVNAIVILKGVCNDCSDTVVFNEWERVVSSGVSSRMLQEEESFNFEPSKCFCPVNTNSTTDNISTGDLVNELQNRLPAVDGLSLDVQFILQLSVSECLQTLSGTIDDALLQEYCGEEPTPYPTVAPTISAVPSAAPTKEYCDVKLEVKFVTQILMTVYGESLSDDDILTLGSDFVVAYNDFNSQIYSTCDESYRQISSYFVDRTFERRRLRNEVQRQAQGFSSQTILLGIEGRCESCSENSTLFNDQELTEGAFLETLTANGTADFLLSIEQILSFQEVDVRECSTETLVEFADFVLVEFSTNVTSFSDQEIAIIEEAFVSGYNDLTRWFCDPHRRSLSEAAVTRIFESTDGATPVEFRVVGTCLDCDESVGIYDIPTSILDEVVKSVNSTMSERAKPSSGNGQDNGRTLQDLEFCICPANPRGRRAPFESEFISAFAVSVEELDLNAFDSVVSCTFGTDFTSGVVVKISHETATGLAIDLEAIARSCKFDRNLEWIETCELTSHLRFPRFSSRLHTDLLHQYR
jgi:hypothetical protein